MKNNFYQLKPVFMRSQSRLVLITSGHFTRKKLMPKIRLILIALFGMFLLGCATNGNRNPAFPGKKAGIRCGKGASVVHAECFEAQEKIQQARRKARRKSGDQDSWCGTACLSAKQKKTKTALERTKGKKGIFRVVRYCLFVRQTKSKT